MFAGFPLSVTLRSRQRQNCAELLNSFHAIAGDTLARIDPMNAA
jgi:hypothetical protein